MEKNDTDYKQKKIMQKSKEDEDEHLALNITYLRYKEV